MESMEIYVHDQLVRETLPANTTPVRETYSEALYEPGDCPICTCRLPRAPRRCVLACGHVFCAVCLETFAVRAGFKLLDIENNDQYYGEHEAACPMCRSFFYIKVDAATRARLDIRSHFMSHE